MEKRLEAIKESMESLGKSLLKGFIQTIGEPISLKDILYLGSIIFCFGVLFVLFDFYSLLSIPIIFITLFIKIRFL